MNGNQDRKKHKQLLINEITTQEMEDYEFDNDHSDGVMPKKYELEKMFFDAFDRDVKDVDKEYYENLVKQYPYQNEG